MSRCSQPQSTFAVAAPKDAGTGEVKAVRTLAIAQVRSPPGSRVRALCVELSEG